MWVCLCLPRAASYRTWTSFAASSQTSSGTCLSSVPCKCSPPQPTTPHHHITTTIIQHHSHRYRHTAATHHRIRALPQRISTSPPQLFNTTATTHHSITQHHHMSQPLPLPQYPSTSQTHHHLCHNHFTPHITTRMYSSPQPHHKHYKTQAHYTAAHHIITPHTTLHKLNATHHETQNTTPWRRK